MFIAYGLRLGLRQTLLVEFTAAIRIGVDIILHMLALDLCNNEQIITPRNSPRKVNF